MTEILGRVIDGHQYGLQLEDVSAFALDAGEVARIASGNFDLHGADRVRTSVSWE